MHALETQDSAVHVPVVTDFTVARTPLGIHHVQLPSRDRSRRSVRQEVTAHVRVLVRLMFDGRLTREACVAARVDTQIASVAGTRPLNRKLNHLVSPPRILKKKDTHLHFVMPPVTRL